MTNIDNISESQICQLRDEAANAGDFAQVETCNQALAELDRPWEGTDALEWCVCAIQDAEAQSELPSRPSANRRSYRA